MTAGVPRTLLVRMLLALALVAGVLAVVLTPAGPQAAAAPVASPPNTVLPAGQYCNQTPTQPGSDPSSYNGPTKVLQIFGENQSANEVDGDAADAQFALGTLGAQCGVLSNMHGETHPSEPNYLDDVNGGGNPQWTLCDVPPNSPAGSCPYGASGQLSSPSIMSTAESAFGLSGWKVYGESQASNCQMTNGASGGFVVRHNPPQYFTNVACSTNDIPAGNWQAHTGSFYSDVVNGTLPNFSMYTPNNTDDGHDPTSQNPPSVNIGNNDSALSSVMALIQSGPDYQSGHLIVMVTFDEGTTTGVAPYTDARTGEDCTDPSQADTKPSCQILTYIVGRYVPWSADNDFTNHYSMLRASQEVLGISPTQGYSWLGAAATANDFYRPFKLAPDSWSTDPTPTPPAPSIPSAPVAVHAVAGSSSAIVSFTAPATSGGGPITSYTVTSSPGGIAASGANSPVLVTGLTPGTSYTFTVTATNAFGAGPPSPATNAVLPTNGSLGPELLPDPGFESGASGWVAFQHGTFTTVTTPVHGGTKALSVTAPDAAKSLTGLTQNSVVTSATAGQTYTASCWVRATSSGLKMTLRLLEYTPNWATSSTLQQTLLSGLSTTAWTQLTVSASAVTAGDRIVPQIYSNNQTPSTGAVVYDDCSVRAGAAGTTVPGPPANVTATGADRSATVSFSPPASSGGSPITSYTVTSAPGGMTATAAAGPITVTGLTNGTRYTFTVMATNTAGTGSASAPSPAVAPAAAVHAPGVPTGLTATPGDASLGLTWTAPADNGGSALTDYVVQYSRSGQGQWVALDQQSTATAASITGLINGTAYDVEVEAVNAVGPGGFGSPVTATPQAAGTATVPDAPTGVSAVAGDASATVSFSPPANNGGSTITGYTVTSSPGGLVGTGAAAPITVSGLTNGTAYTFTITATNPVGTGAASTPSTAVTPMPAATVPGPASGLSATPGNGQVALTWTAGATGGSPITDWVVQYVVSGGTGWVTAPDGSSPTPSATVTGLTNGTAYDLRVAAVNGVGTGPWSTPVTTTPATVPGMPTAVTATAGNGTASVAFTAPTSTGGAVITSYTVTSTPGNVTVVTAGSPVTVSGLTNGTTYTFTVTATNSVGSGPVSAASGPVTPINERLPDPGFEASTGGWTAFQQGTFTRATAPVLGGTYALLITSPTTAATQTGMTQNAVVADSVAGVNYTFSCWVRPASTPLNLTARFLEYPQNWSSATHFTAVTTISKLPLGTWTQIKVINAAVKSGERMVPQLYSTNETSATGGIYIDNCSVSN